MPLSRIRPDYSYKTIALASFLLLIFSFFLTPAARAAEDYVIDNVIEDADGKDINEDRAKAISQAQIDAFRQLINRRNSARANDIITKTTTSEINRLVSGYEILEEKITPEHYHSVLRVAFSKQGIDTLLPDAQPVKPAVDAKENKTSKAVLVLPVYKEGGTLKLWQDENKWRDVWFESALISGQGLVITPQGNLDDRVDVDDANIESATSKSLERMYDRYGVGSIYVLFAYFNKKADPKPTLEVTLKKLKDDNKDETSRMDYIIRSTENLDTLMARASNDIAQYLYKVQTINPDKIEYDRLKEVNARVNAVDIQEWETLRKRLLEHGNIVGIKLTSISFYETHMTITFKGTPDMLGKTLVAAGLRVMQDGDDLVLVLK